VLPGFFKFPRTRHVLHTGGTAVARDDLVMDEAEAAGFFDGGLARYPPLRSRRLPSQLVSPGARVNPKHGARLEPPPYHLPVLSRITLPPPSNSPLVFPPSCIRSDGGHGRGEDGRGQPRPLSHRRL